MGNRFATAPLSPQIKPYKMNIEVIAEHSVDVDLLPEKAKILDLGCRGMLFTNEMRRLGHEVIALDCDDLGSHIPYWRMAVSDYNGRAGVKKSRDPQATTITVGNDIVCVTLQNLSELTSTPFWDVIKLDIEGSEYEVIMSMDRPYAKQLSIEFHLHTGVYGEAEMLLMENKLLSLGYFPVKHDKTRQHGLSYNYWDSLFILQ